MRQPQEGLVGELDVPFGALPAGLTLPPLAGEEVRAVAFFDGARVGTGEEGKGAKGASVRFGGDFDGDGGGVSFQRQGCCPEVRACGFKLAGWLVGVAVGDGVGVVGVEWDGGAETVGAEEGLDAGEGVGELVGVSE